MYEPSEGCIVVGGLSLGELAPAQARGLFALVSQDAPVLSGTVRENIAYGIPDCHD